MSPTLYNLPYVLLPLSSRRDSSVTTIFFDLRVGSNTQQVVHGFFEIKFTQQIIGNSRLRSLHRDVVILKSITDNIDTELKLHEKDCL